MAKAIVMDVRPLRPDEGLIYRSLRLRALRDTPDAFGQTLAEAESLSDAEWIQRAGEIAACPEREVLFIARDGDIPCGTVYLRSESGVTELYAMWVDPAFRRRHVASALLEAAISWARDRHASQVELWVTEGNAAAANLIDARGLLAQARKMSSAPVQWFGFNRWCINLESDTPSDLHVDMRP
jgi:GNAT superfamily N-acetyltransferase